MLSYPLQMSNIRQPLQAFRRPDFVLDRERAASKKRCVHSQSKSLIFERRVPRYFLFPDCIYFSIPRSASPLEGVNSNINVEWSVRRVHYLYVWTAARQLSINRLGMNCKSANKGLIAINLHSGPEIEIQNEAKMSKDC